MPSPPESNPPQPNRTADTIGIYRILDAEANRAAEGLRVVEDYLRFVLADGHLTEMAKRLRHELKAALTPLESADRLAARESATDVGAVLATPPGSERATPADVAAASFKRIQQALRSLEEYAKLVDPNIAAAIEPLRFRVYTLEKSAGLTAASLARLAGAQLYVLVDGRQSEQEFAKLIASLVSSGVHLLQLRDKQLDDRQLLARAVQLRRLTRETGTLFIMNDRPDLAALADADGVHVGQEELSVHEARQIVGPRSLIGVSTHTIEQARQAVLDGANYIGVGPTFPSTTKSFTAFTGLDFIRAVSAEISLPAFAIGGITHENVPQVISAGLRRIAVTGAVMNANDPSVAAKELMAMLAEK
ncbi:MAG TPA: thiamine phosphate synthase [Pirellulales bacterium]|jgi:thiamine-phosphate pyrophosphorylase